MRINLYFLLGCLVLSSCGAGRVIVSIPKEYCAPTISYAYDSASRPLADPDSLVRQIPAPANFLTPHDVLTANAIGALPVVRQWVRTFGDTSTPGRLRCLELKTQIHDRVLSAETEINSIAAELDCEGERADQLGAYLDNINKKRTNLLTAASIIAAAGTTIATVLVQGDGAKNGVAIGGGVYTADDLHTRANMLNQVQATVRSINQDLQGLLLDLSASPAAR